MALSRCSNYGRKQQSATRQPNNAHTQSNHHLFLIAMINHKKFGANPRKSIILGLVNPRLTNTQAFTKWVNLWWCRSLDYWQILTCQFGDFNLSRAEFVFDRTDLRHIGR